MARSTQPLTAALWLGLGAALLVAALVLGTLGAVLWRAGGPGLLTVTDLAALRFTMLQAGVSAIFSVVLAVPVARALARRRFGGRGLLILLMGAPFILPVVVAVLGLLAVFGHNGLLNLALARIGLPEVEVYGLHGVVLAHVFFNMPLATRLILQGWQTIPAERFRLAAALGLRPSQVMRHLELPMLAQLVPGVLLAIFLICLSSFAVALMLGGGPAATTLELAIYQAFRFDGDLARAASLGLLQVAVGAIAAAPALVLVLPSGHGSGLDRPIRRWDAGTLLLRLQDGLILVLAAGFLILPLALLATRGLPHLGLPPSVWLAAGRSLLVAGASAAMAVGLGLALALAALRWRGLEAVGMLVLAASPLVLGTGLFLLIQPWANASTLALPLTAIVNGLIAVPFVLRSLVPPLRGIEAGYGRLADSLALSGRARLRWLILPRLRRPLGFAAGLAAALSIGDLGVVALFADPTAATLPLMIYRLMGSYQMDAAAGAALLLLAMSLGLFWALDRKGQADADA